MVGVPRHCRAVADRESSRAATAARVEGRPTACGRERGGRRQPHDGRAPDAPRRYKSVTNRKFNVLLRLQKLTGPSPAGILTGSLCCSRTALMRFAKPALKGVVTLAIFGVV